MKNLILQYPLFHLAFCLIYILFSANCSAESPSEEPLKKAVLTQTRSGSVNSALNNFPDFVMSSQGQRLSFDFSLKVKPVSSPDLNLTQYANSNLVIFYFSAKCMHCLNVLPQVQTLAEHLKTRNIPTVAISIENNSEDEIRQLIRKYKCPLPVFRDQDRVFSSKYGTGRIPLLLLVNGKGHFIRINKFEGSQTDSLVNEILISQDFL
jgi:peroxiredoxin